ncbi:hypothetical protein MATL_G00229030 [Megalops atlanticus]|uniref:Immunoglobulin domain-containing protein n=1 Tax=Megalops atlanticus TaxID=7932 RepID=A0A9D3PD38_MEGAT|nr:hypothetical protein MATL_G00229030 [Megalops atlanticus]
MDDRIDRWIDWHVVWLSIPSTNGGCRPSEISASFELRLVQPRSDAVLPCSLPFRFENQWFLVRSEEIVPLTSTTKRNIDNKTSHVIHSNNRSHLSLEEDNRTSSISLRIRGVEDSDLGLYFCVERKDGGLRFGRGVRLAFTDPGSEGPSVSCWTLLSFVPVASAVLTALCVYGLSHGRALGKFICRNGVNKDGNKDLHYASLQLHGKACPPQQRETPPLLSDVIYSVVAHQTPANQCF